jgi:serine/threonine protein kinase
MAIVVKMSGKQKDAMSTFTNEVDILKGLRHPGICSLLHSGAMDDRPWIALEHMAGGSLHSLLHSEHNEHNLESALLSRIVAQVASGLSYLHESGVIHRDLKTANVLLDAALHAKLCDFGLSTRFGRAEYSAERGTYRQMAPEILLRKPYDHRIDVYSYGILLWETLHCKEPFAGMLPLQAAFAVAMQEARPQMDLREEHQPYAELICACWDGEPTNRPEMNRVAEAAAALLAAVSGEQVMEIQ